MPTISHDPSHAVRARRTHDWLTSELWASLAISVMWLAVLFDAVFGPNIVSSTPGGTSSSVPSAVAVALFAFLATWAVAHAAFRRP